ncbi:MAG: metallophosphoesterase [Deltaproteobacteria bacterium]|nr:metallophosphoesterase [Deltaproteobacteria bacterium]
MANRYLVVSDLHLADVEDNPDGWKAYKSSRYLFDDEFDRLVRRFVAEAEGGDRLALVLNGDIFDFDVVTAVPEKPPWPVRRFERRRGLDATAEKSVWKLERMLEHHPRFLATLAGFVADGHELIYVLGNHDREFHFPEVRRALVAALERRAAAAGRSLAIDRVLFRPWFHYVRDEIYIEHGHQYDMYTTFRHQLWPTVERRGKPTLALPMGNLSNRYLMTRMGYFNPHASDYILNAFRYLVHWLRYYAFSRRSLVVSWFWGSLVVMVMLFRTKKRLLFPPPEHAERLAEVAGEYGLGLDDLRALGQLQRKPITSRMFRLFRELWLDRVLIALAMCSGTVALALLPVPLWAKLMVPLSTFPLLYFIYEQLAEGETIFTLEQEIPERARAVARMLPARVVTFGHTHKPRLIPLGETLVFVDTGAWAPIMSRRRPAELRPGFRNYLLAVFRDGKPEVEFGSWMDPGQARVGSC